MPVKTLLNGNAPPGTVPVKIYAEDIEPAALQQLKNIAQLPIVHSHIAAMPDVHLGKGATVGSVIPTVSAIIPAAVGVDIGCGMNAVRTSLFAHQLPDNLRALRDAIEVKVPVGQRRHKLISARESACKNLAPGVDRLFSKHPGLMKKLRQPQKTWVTQMGTLGGGNHFIELCLDESGAVWVMLHSGSRGIGNAIGQYFIQKARRDMSGHMHNLPDKDLAYFSEGCENFEEYIEAVNWAQEYARLNRQEMMKLVLACLRVQLPAFTLTSEAINCHHNYVVRENHFARDVFVTRKGAISAQRDQLGIIPGSMGAKSFVVRGLGNPESFCSCAHGAGRKMSRSAARQRFSRRDLEEQTRGIQCRKDSGVLDEIPAAYKDIDTVMENQSDLVEVVHTLRQVVCIKG
ncbi:RtcB family protein [Microbulbifer sp. OS29]|uniref:3'-phosphate/5'-hydroxy nucleic acid ligase n=1 Tax=Microbulbifer okhotskensis TaxID=2926617 RepID=A0A9X2EKH1_9GAMM|nr:RtcB family protein [Microbulbifer okhotskensis]MCO1333309.1 RtcB family protein [Microbulbifer okhotskensis]